MEAQANLPSRPVGKGGRVGLVGRARAAEVRVAVAGGLAEVEGDQDGGRVIRSELHARPIREAGTGGDFDLPHGPFGTGGVVFEIVLRREGELRSRAWTDQGKGASNRALPVSPASSRNSPVAGGP